jgi:predicted nucleic acid-binding protein
MNSSNFACTHRRLGAMDLKIVAIVLANNAIPLTRKRRDFKPIAGIRLLDLA